MTQQAEQEHDESTSVEPEPHELEPDDEDLEEDEGDDDQEREELGDEQQRQAAAQTEKEIERNHKALEKNAVRHVKRVAEVLGDDFAMLKPCPRCWPLAPGFYWPPDVAPVTAELAIAVRASIGEEVLPEYQQDTHRTACTSCGGWGRVRTGSKVSQQDALACLDCAGKGWIGDTKVATGGVARNGEVAPDFPLPLGPIEPEEPVEDADPWGTPVGAPYYGVLLNLRPAGWQDEVAAWKLSQGVT